MGEEIKPSVNHEEDTMSCTFHWRQEYDCPEIISVEVVLGHSAGVNNDIFEIYTEGVFVKDNSPLMVFPLERNNQSDPTKFSTKLNLPKRTYQFIFRIEDAEKGKSFAISKYYQQTTLVSGRIVNYLEAEGTVNSQDQVFEDINESSRLLGKAHQKKGSKKERGCGCGPDRCSVL